MTTIDLFFLFGIGWGIFVAIANKQAANFTAGFWEHFGVRFSHRAYLAAFRYGGIGMAFLAALGWWRIKSQQ
jgi:hypothetical protein